MRYMPDDLAKWYLCDRAKRRRGDGPWLYVTSPNVSSAYKVPQTARCIWEWAGSISCVKIQLFAGFEKVVD